MDFYINYISIYRGVFRNFPLFIKTLPFEILIRILVRVPSSTVNVRKRQITKCAQFPL